MQKMTVFSPAKLNLHLAVQDKRADGFHNLESVFLALDFGDTLHFEPIPGKNALELAMEGLEGLPMEKNIIFRAVSLFREKTGFSEGLKIRVEKRIPLGGGLGGGSSNAAAALLALNKLFAGEGGAPLPLERLLEMGAALGSDVPFFVHQTPAAWVTGRGENIEPIAPPDCCFVLVNPGFHSDTAAAFGLLKTMREFSHGVHGGHGGGKGQQPREPRVPRELRVESFSKNFSNDFLPVFPEPQKSAYSSIISKLREMGADFASLSGAGSTCFGAFGDKSKTEPAASALRKTWGFVKICRPLNPLTM